MALPAIDNEFLVDFLANLLNTPSPTGFAHQALAFTELTLSVFPEVQLSYTRKGALVAVVPGESDDARRALTAHVDTLGLMVREIKSSGRLKTSPIGGIM